MALALLTATAAAQTRPVADIDALIQTLAEADPSVRQHAAQQLIAMGADARPHLLAAMESDNPEIRARAGEILRELPWHRAADPQPVKEILEKYGKMEEGQRFIAAGKLAMLPDQQGHVALLRLAVEEPSDRVRWLVVAILREQSMYGPAKRTLAQLDTNSQHSSIVLLSSWGWYQVDTERSQQLMRRAVDLEMKNWRQPNTEMLLALSVLTEDAIAHADYTRAAELLRLHIHFADPAGVADDPSSNPAMQLLALHADHGPLEGFAQDFDQHRALLGRRETLYVAARLLRRWHCPVAGDISQSVLVVDQPSQDQHFVAGDFLMSRQWYDWAKSEFEAALAQQGDDSDPLIGVSMRFRLSQLAIARNDDAAAAEQMEQAMRLITGDEMLLRRRGDGAELADNTIWAEIHFRRWRAARHGNRVEADQHLTELLKLNPSDIEIAIEIVPALDQMKRQAEADKVFDAAYASLKKLLDDEPQNPEHMNNLAWLCARCDRKLDQAMDLSKSATAELPENYAYLDTAAEACFRTGDAQRAVVLETKALRFRPRDKFMLEQLERFRAGR